MSSAGFSRHLSLLALTSALALSACGDDGGGDGNNTEADARTNNNIDGGADDPDAQAALPACADAEASYASAESVEVVDFFGPNVSLLLGGGDVAVIFPSGSEYDVGDFDLSAESAWTVTFCVDYDENISDCGADLVPQSGTLKITTLNDDADAQDRRIAGQLVDAVFVDDADSPTCQTTVNASFDEPLPE